MHVLLIFHQVGLNVNLIHFYPRLPLILSFSLFQSISYFLSLISYFGFSPWTKLFFFLFLWNSTHFFSVWLSSLLLFWLSSGCGMHSYGFGSISFSESFFHTQLSSSFTTICNLHPKITNRTNFFFIISSSSSSFIYHCYGCL